MKKLIFLFALGMILLAGVGSAVNPVTFYDFRNLSNLGQDTGTTKFIGDLNLFGFTSTDCLYFYCVNNNKNGTTMDGKTTTSGTLMFFFKPQSNSSDFIDSCLAIHQKTGIVSGDFTILVGNGTSGCNGKGNYNEGLKLFIKNQTGEFSLMYPSEFSFDNWYHFAVKINTSGTHLYINGLKVNETSNTSPGFFHNEVGTTRALLGAATLADSVNATFANFKFFDNELSDDEILSEGLLNYINLISPINNEYIYSKNVIFTVSFHPGVEQIAINATINLYKDEVLFNKTTNVIDGDYTFWNISNFVAGNYKWNVLGCFENGGDTVCRYSINNTFYWGWLENSIFYNSTTYETASETFILNTTLASGITSSSATFYYNGTNKGTATKTSDGTNTIFTSTIDIPSGTGSKDFYWTLNLNGELFNTTTNTQTVSQTLLGLCNATLTTKYINYTFKDELTLANINGSFVSSLWEYYLGGGAVSKTLSFINATENPSYAFCLIPTHPTLKQDTIIQYTSTGYPQRRHFTTGDLTNTTTNTVLYLLGSSDGIYSAIQVTNLIGSPIQDVTVTIEKQIGGVWTVLGSEQSDGSGLVTFWVDPNSDHRITAGKTGYLSTTQTIRPTQTTYTIILAQSTGNVSFQSDLEGLKWQFRPSAGIVQNGTAINFNVTITAEKENLVSCQFSLMNSTGVISSTTSSCSSGSGFLSLTYTPSQNEKVYGIFYVDVGNGLFVLDGDAYWIAHNTNISQARTLRGVLESMAQLNEFGEGVEQEFSRIVFFFFALAIGMGLICYFTGYDFSNPGFTISILFGVILFASISGWFQYEGLIKTSTLINEGAKAWLNKYIYSVTIGFLFCGWLLNQIRRTQ